MPRNTSPGAIVIARPVTASALSGAAPDAHIEAVARGDISPELLVNDLATVAIAQFPEIGRLKGLLEDSGARAAQMSGSGGAVFGLYHDAPTAEAAALRIHARAPDALVRAVATTSLAELHNSAFSTEVLSSC